MARRTLLFRALAILLPLLVLGIIAEVVLQLRAGGDFGDSAVVHRRSDDPGLVYEFRPDTKTVVDGVEYAVNPQGFRDAPFADPAQASPRIVVIGDSVAAGWGVSMEDAFPQRLESALGGDAAVYNLSIDGYGTRQQLRLLEARGLALKPDLIILSYTLNDADESGRGLERHYSTRFELWSLLSRGFRSIVESSQGLPSEYHKRIHARNAERTKEYLQTFAAHAKAKNIPLILAITPVFEGPLDDDGYRWKRLHAQLSQLGTDCGFVTIDLRPALAQANAETPVAHDIWHPTAHGHSVMAEALNAPVRAALNAPVRAALRPADQR